MSIFSYQTILRLQKGRPRHLKPFHFEEIQHSRKEVIRQYAVIDSVFFFESYPQ